MGTINTTTLYPNTYTKLGSAIDLSTEVEGILPITNGGLGVSAVSAGRVALGLTDYATLATAVPIISGGTGQSTVSAARTAFGLTNFATLVSAVPMLSGGTGQTTLSGTQVALEIHSSSTPSFSALSITETVSAAYFRATGGIPSVVDSPNAGTSPAAAISGSDTSFLVRLSSGSADTDTGTIFTVTYAKTYTTVPKVTFNACNAAAVSAYFFVVPALTGFNFNTTVALGFNTTYLWNFHVLQ